MLFRSFPPELEGVDLNKQTDADVAAKSDTCTACHAGAHDPHYKTTVRLGCTDCHGGDASATSLPGGLGVCVSVRLPRRDAISRTPV